MKPERTRIVEHIYPRALELAESLLLRVPPLREYFDATDVASDAVKRVTQLIDAGYKFSSTDKVLEYLESTTDMIAADLSGRLHPQKKTDPTSSDSIVELYQEVSYIHYFSIVQLKPSIMGDGLPAQEGQEAGGPVDEGSSDTGRRDLEKIPSRHKGPHSRLVALAGHGGQVTSLEDKVKELIPALSDYDGQVNAASTLNAAVRSVMAERLAPVLNAKIQAMPHDTLDQKKALADWVTDQLEPLGLAVQDPKSGLPAKLRGTTGNWPGVGTFCFEVYKAGKRVKSAYSNALPELQLIDATPTPQPEGVWQSKVGAMPSKDERSR